MLKSEKYGIIEKKINKEQSSSISINNKMKTGILLNDIGDYKTGDKIFFMNDVAIRVDDLYAIEKASILFAETQDEEQQVLKG